MARNGTTKYTPEVRRRLLDAIGLGATRGLACLYGGINHETLNIWERKYPEFAAAMREAEGRAVVGWLAKIEQAANNGTWAAAAWKLERRYPEVYGRVVAGVYAANAPAEAVPITHLVIEAPPGTSDGEETDGRAVSDGGHGSDPLPAPRPIRRLAE